MSCKSEFLSGLVGAAVLIAFVAVAFAERPVSGLGFLGIGAVGYIMGTSFAPHNECEHAADS